MEPIHEPLYMEEMHIVVQDETELEELDFLVEKWKKHAKEQNIAVGSFVANYLASKADGDSLRHPESGLLPRITFEQQKRVRAMEINQMIHHIGSEEINRTENSALKDPLFEKLCSEIKEDAKYLRRMLPPEISMEHPTIAAGRYRSMSDELARLKGKVISKL